MMTDPYVPEPHDESPTEPPVRTGPWGALIRILFSPADAFALIRARSPWLPAYLLQGVVAAVVAVAGMFVVGDVIAEQMGAAPELAELGAVTDGLVVVFAVIGGAFAFVGPVIAGLIFALVLYISGMIFNNKASFSQLFSLSGYAEIPAMLGAVLSLILIAVAPEQAASFDLSLAVLVPGAPALVSTLLSMLSPFTLWTWVLVAVGLSHVGQVPARTAWWQTFTVFIAAALTRLAFGSLAASFASFGTNLPM